MFRWHAAGTYDYKTKTGGPNGSIKNPQELAHGANAGLSWAVEVLEPLKAEFPILSYADFYQVNKSRSFQCLYRSVTFCLQLAGVVAVEVTGGPTIEFHPGRKVQESVLVRLMRTLNLNWLF